MTVRMVQHVKLGTAANTCKVWIRSWSRNLPCSPSFLPICLSLSAAATGSQAIVDEPPDPSPSPPQVPSKCTPHVCT